MTNAFDFTFSAGLDEFRSSGPKNIKRPREFAFYSLDKERNVLPLSTASLKYSYPCMSNAPNEFGDDLVQGPEHLNQISLRQGYASFEKYDDSADEHLDAILDTLEAYETQAGVKVQPDFVMFRGMMTKLLTAPYEHGHDASFEMNATLFQNTIFIEQNKAHKLAEEQARQQRDRSRPQRNDRHSANKPNQDEMAYWGYKFETLCVLNRPYVETSRSDIEARKTAIVSNAEQYCSLVNTGIDDITIVLAGEVDAVKGTKPDDPDAAIPWVELKTNRVLVSENDYRYWAEKLLRVWTQSYLLGVPTIIVGFRSQFGQLVKIEQYETSSLPAVAKRIAVQQGKGDSWNGSVCINFAGAFLRLIRQNITQPGVVWRIQRLPGQSQIKVFVLEGVLPDSIIKPSFLAHRQA